MPAKKWQHSSGRALLDLDSDLLIAGATGELDYLLTKTRHRRSERAAKESSSALHSGVGNIRPWIYTGEIL